MVGVTVLVGVTVGVVVNVLVGVNVFVGVFVGVIVGVGGGLVDVGVGVGFKHTVQPVYWLLPKLFIKFNVSIPLHVTCGKPLPTPET